MKASSKSARALSVAGRLIIMTSDKFICGGERKPDAECIAARMVRAALLESPTKFIHKMQEYLAILLAVALGY